MMRRFFFLFTVFVLTLLVACTPEEAIVVVEENSAESAATATEEMMTEVDETPEEEEVTETPAPTETSETPEATATQTASPSPIPPTSTATPTPTPEPTVSGSIRSNQLVNVRSGPGTDFDSFSAVAPGTDVELMGQNDDGDWFQIKLEDGRIGWIAARLIEPNGPLPSSVSTSPDDPDETAAAEGGEQAEIPPVDLVGANLTVTALLTTVPSATPLSIGSSDEVLDVEITPTALEVDQLVSPLTLLTQPAGVGGNGTPDVTSREEEGGVPVDVASPTEDILDIPTIRNGSGIDVFAFCDNTIYGISAPTVGVGSTIDIFWSWFAFTESQVQDHIRAARHQLTVNGDRVTNISSYRTALTPSGNQWEVSWFVPYGPLTEPGTYTIEYQVTWASQIFDGQNFFGPGSGITSEEESCTFEVQ